MRIKIDEESREQFEERDLQYVRLLKGDKFFEALIRRARKICGTEKEAFKGRIPEDLTTKSEKHARIIIDLYGLPSSWLFPLSNLIILHKLTPPYSSIFLSGLSTHETNGLATDLVITVKQKTSWDDFRRWINSHKKVIKEHLEKLPPKNSKIRSNFKLKLDVFKLYQQGLKPKVIADKLSKKYEDRRELSDQITEPNISRWIFELNKVLNREPRK